MRIPRANVGATFAVVGLLLVGTVADARELSLAERFDAQRAIESVYHRHRSGGSRPFEEAVPASVIARKAEDALRLSVALDRFWSTPLTGAMLSAEVERMARDTRMPGRLRELFAALGNDPFLIRETLARRTLASRLARRFFAADGRLHSTAAGEPRSWDSWWSEVRASLDPGDAPTAAEDGGSLPEVNESACSNGIWNNRSLDDVPDPRRYATSVWTGSEMLVWGGYNGSIPLDTGGRYDPAIDDWTAISRGKGKPQRRYRHSAVWTGSQMIVWGGATTPGGGLTDTGGRYDPVTDGWTATTTTGAPSARWRHTAVWTGSEMLIWGGQSVNGEGFRYDPTTNSWSAMSSAGEPTGRKDHTAIWTGSQMIVWGGTENDIGGNPRRTGGRYEPALDTWFPMSTPQALEPRSNHTAVWTGSQMIVWGGTTSGGGGLGTGGAYDPSRDLWAPTNPTGAPAARRDHIAVWSGSEMIVWGGSGGGGALDDGGRYDPAGFSWAPITTGGAPEGRSNAAAVWDGSRMLVWGGIGLRDLNSGGRYDPATDSWTPTTVEGTPLPRRGHTAVWSGAEMIVWGGSAGPNLDTGASWDPTLDTWTEVSTTDAPSPRVFHSAVWTGDRMVIWGGGTDTGGRYDPAADAWSPTSLFDAPSSRRRHTAVWSGSEMIVWGGWSGGAYFDDGARYDPGNDSWTPMTTASPPPAREAHTAVWTGSQMLVWGGVGSSGFTDTGGRYDPATDTWIPTDSTGAPTPRVEHSALWSGSEMLVWGGDDDTAAQAVNSGGRYDPATDVWVATEDGTAATPSARRNHVAVWTGIEMLVWGGRIPGSPMDEFPELGGRYDPATDGWAQMTGTGAPPGRHDLSVVWTGDEMIVWGGASAALAEMSTGGAYCSCATSEFFRDDDGDGFGDPSDSVLECTAPPGFVADGTDCDDADPDVWGTPGEVGGVRWPDAATLEWDPPVRPGAVALVYDVVRSESPDDFGVLATCTATNIAATSADDPEEPAPGSLRSYLVRAENGCPAGEGSLGQRSDGSDRTARSCP